jgi:hypothetical protein
MQSVDSPSAVAIGYSLTNPTCTEAATSLYTIIEVARANGIEPIHYLKFLFSCIERFGKDKMP